ncbi:aromatase/cyclase [Allorhizocola rhizosphaerae]|uniref:aromatase/cyclase n=1 Tax=Allorhizocola rhizosphaerae TaxID=1872709 RepID=UPI000E3E7D8C|nr:aromatase/cyclase [Allorhizocola rhizosphaerae]
MGNTVTPNRTHVTTHIITVNAPAQTIYGLISDVTKWPYIFSPTVHVQTTQLDANNERLRLWAFANGQVRTWVSRRTLDPENLRIRFHQVITSPPVESMGGEWVLEPLADGTTRVVLLHDFTIINDDPDDRSFVTRAVDSNSNAELAALKRAAELGEYFNVLVLTFSDTVSINGALGDVYDFLYRADLWPERLPHVARLDLTEDVTNIQSMVMDTKSVDGSIHTTKSVRVCSPNKAIIYKQTETPEIMAAHTGRWDVREVDGAVELTSTHTVVIRPEVVSKVLGPDGTVQQAREKIQHALSTNSMTTMRHAKAYAEAEV